MNDNTGHGHVWARPDGVRARCGGPKLCRECAADAARYDESAELASQPEPEVLRHDAGSARFVLAIARQEPFSNAHAERDGRACNWCGGIDSGQDMPHVRGCIWVEAAAWRVDLVDDVRQATGAAQRGVDEAIQRHIVNERIDDRLDRMYGPGVGGQVRAWAEKLGGADQRWSVGDWITAADTYLCAGARPDQLTEIPSGSWQMLARLHGSPDEAAMNVMTTLNILGLPLEQR